MRLFIGVCIAGQIVEAPDLGPGCQLLPALFSAHQEQQSATKLADNAGRPMAWGNRTLAENGAPVVRIDSVRSRYESVGAAEIELVLRVRRAARSLRCWRVRRRRGIVIPVGYLVGLAGTLLALTLFTSGCDVGQHTVIPGSAGSGEMHAGGSGPVGGTSNSAAGGAGDAGQPGAAARQTAARGAASAALARRRRQRRPPAC